MSKEQEALKNISDYFKRLAEMQTEEGWKKCYEKSKEVIDTTITEMDSLKEENARLREENLQMKKMNDLSTLSKHELSLLRNNIQEIINNRTE